MRIREGLVALMGAIFVTTGVAAWREGTASSAAGPVVSLEPPSQVATVGERVTIDVAVANVTNLAAWEVELTFDPDVLKFESFVEQPFMAGSRRSVSCLDPVAHSNGRVQLGCVSSGEENRTPIPGAAGAGTVGRVTFSTTGTGTTAIEITRVGLSDPLGDDCCGPIETHEAAVRVVASQQDEASTAPPPTPTPNPRKLTPTPVNATPGPSLVLTPSAGSEPPAGTGGVAGAVTSPGGSAAERASAGDDDLFRSASGAATAGERRSPRAGEGSLATARDPAAGMAFTALGLAGLSFSVLSAVGRTVRRRTL
ncbi:MAG TPA: cohesin domain-containing protein [Dehalococcoidia bacterium]|nr:cohesin domain-containing protein [Dehalococcoidia bacterium]